MEVKKILKLCATLLQMKDMIEIIENSEYLNENDNEELKLLLSCINLTNNAIATDYIELTKTKLIKNSTGTISFSELSSDPIYKIIKIKNAFGEKVNFKINANELICPKGSLSITYSYFPKEYGYSDIIDEFKSKITERVFAFGVLSEYLFIKGNFDDASIWEDRFKNAMRNVVRNRHEVVMPRRRWW